MSTYTLTIVTPEKTVFSGQVRHMKAMNSQGYFGILHNHAPFITTLDAGDISINLSNDDTEPKKFLIGGGCLKFYKNKCLVLADSVS